MIGYLQSKFEALKQFKDISEINISMYYSGNFVIALTN